MLAGVTLAGPVFGYQAVVIRGASMSPAIPSGALVLVVDDGADAGPGDVVTVRRSNGRLVTHRVVRVVEAEPPMLELRGDANESPDAALAPVSTVIGTVAFSIPLAGYLAFVLQQPAGLLGLASLIVSLLVLLRLLDREPDRPVAGNRPHGRVLTVALLAVAFTGGNLGTPAASLAAFGDSQSADSSFQSGSW